MKILTVIITLSVCILLVIFSAKKLQVKVLIKNKTITLQSYYLIALVAPILLLGVKALTIKEVSANIVKSAAVNPLQILVLFFSMCYISLCLDGAGFFKYCAAKTLSLAKKGQKSLFFYLYAFVAILTVFSSNDIVILSFTPFVYYFCKDAKVAQAPYIAALFTAANTLSLMLIIGNPTNIYIASWQNISFLRYFLVMFLPSIAAAVSGYLFLRLMFNKQLKQPLQNNYVQNTKIKDKLAAIISLTMLLVTIILMSLSAYLSTPMWKISLFCAITLAFLLTFCKLFTKNKQNLAVYAATKLPYGISLFLLSMITCTLALEKYGLTQSLAKLLYNSASSNLGLTFVFGISSTLCSNILNNIPMSVLYAQILNTQTAPTYAVYASIIGSNIGALLSPTGALAGIMFMQILKEKDAGFNHTSFIKYLLPTAVTTLLFALGALWLVLSLF